MQNEKELPIKENDHAMDALRYAIYNHQGGVPQNLGGGSNRFL